MGDTYMAHVHCTNCGQNSKIDIPVGVRVDSVLSRTEPTSQPKCPNCECRSLQKIN